MYAIIKADCVSAPIVVAYRFNRCPYLALYCLSHLGPNEHCTLGGNCTMRSYFTSAGGAAVARTITDLRTLKDSHGTHEAAKEVNKFAKLVLYKYCLDNWYDNEKVDAGAQFDIIKEEHKKLFLELNPNENYEQVQFDTEDIKANVDRKRNHEIDLANELAKKLKKRLTTGTSILSDIELEAIRQAEGKAIEIEKELEEESEQTQAEAEQTQAEQVQAEDEEMAT